MRSADVVDKGRGAILLGVGLSFVTVPNVALAFTTLGPGLIELVVLSAFAWTLTVFDVLIGGEVRGTLAGVVAVLGFAKLALVAAINNPGVTEVATFVTLFPPGAFACGCAAVVVVPDAFVVVLESTPLSSEESSSYGTFGSKSSRA